MTRELQNCWALTWPIPDHELARSIPNAGSDKPDLRNPLELVDVADLLKDVEFKVFYSPAMKKVALRLSVCRAGR